MTKPPIDAEVALDWLAARSTDLSYGPKCASAIAILRAALATLAAKDEEIAELCEMNAGLDRAFDQSVANETAANRENNRLRAALASLHSDVAAKDAEIERLNAHILKQADKMMMTEIHTARKAEPRLGEV